MKLLCRLFGHDWIGNRASTDFHLTCVRCGAWPPPEPRA